MSSEHLPQSAPQAGPPGARRRRQAAEPAIGAAELGQLHGYDPDDPATWPGNQPESDVSAVPFGQRSLDLTDPRAMRALAHPVRMALIELFGVHGTLTATQASDALGESPANCAFHLRTLAKYGFLEEAGGGRGRERPWKAASTTLSIRSRDLDSEQARAAAGALEQVWLDRWLNRIRNVFAARRWSAEWEEAAGFSETLTFLTADELLAMREEIAAIVGRHRLERQLDPSLRPADALPVEIGVFAYPRQDLAASLSAGERADGDATGDSVQQTQDIS